MSAAVVGINRVRMAPIRARRCSVTLHYPQNWGARPNPLAEELGRRAEAWMGGRCGRDLEIGLGANWAYPFAEDERAEVITKLFAVWACGGGRTGELDQELARTMSPAWRARYGRHVSAEVAERESTLGYLRRRRVEMGLAAKVDLLEYQLGWELPEEVLSDASMRGVMEAAADCVAIGAELFGFREDGSSLVKCAMREFAEEAGEAFKWVANMHTRQVRQVRELETAVLRRYPQHPMLMAWFDALHCMVYGFAQWHSRAPRYQAVHEMEGWKIAVNVSPACPDPF